MEIGEKKCLSALIEIPEQFMNNIRPTEYKLFFEKYQSFVPNKSIKIKFNSRIESYFYRNKRSIQKRLKNLCLYLTFGVSGYLVIYYNSNLEFLLQEFIVFLKQNFEEKAKSRLKQVSVDLNNKFVLGSGLRIIKHLKKRNCCLYFDKLYIKYKNLIEIVAIETIIRIKTNPK